MDANKSTEQLIAESNARAAAYRNQAKAVRAATRAKRAVRREIQRATAAMKS